MKLDLSSQERPPSVRADTLAEPRMFSFTAVEHDYNRYKGNKNLRSNRLREVLDAMGDYLVNWTPPTPLSETNCSASGSESSSSDSDSSFDSSSSSDEESNKNSS